MEEQHERVMSTALSWCAGPAAVAGVLPMSFAATPPVPTRMSLPPAAVWLALARRALASDRYEEALRCFDAAVSHEPRLALAHLGRALCLAQLGREKDAEEATEVVLEAAQGQEEVLYHLAQMCAREGATSVGAPLLRHAVAAIPKLEERAAKDKLFADHPAYLMAIGRL